MPLLMARFMPTRAPSGRSAAPAHHTRRGSNPVVSTAAYKSHYDVLGLSNRATPDEIRAAFRRLAKEKHPDVSQDNNSEEEFMRLKVAYDILSDSSSRAQYDMLLEQRTLGWNPRRTAISGRQRTGSANAERWAASARGQSSVGRRSDDRAASSHRTSSAHPSHQQQQQQQNAAPAGADDWKPASSGRARSSRAPAPSRPSWYGRPVRASSGPRASQQPTSTSPNRGDDWGGWAASARNSANGVTSVNTATRAPSPPPPPPSGPTSGDDWTSTYARVATGNDFGAGVRAATAAAATSSYDEWANTDSPLSSGDDLEWYSDVVVSPPAGMPTPTPTPQAPSQETWGNSGSTTARRASGLAAASKGDDFDLFSSVASKAAETSSGPADASVGPSVASPVTTSMQQQQPTVPTGDDFALFASVAASPLRAAPASPRPEQPPSRRRISTSFSGADSVWESLDNITSMGTTPGAATPTASATPTAAAMGAAAAGAATDAPVTLEAAELLATASAAAEVAVPSRVVDVGDLVPSRIQSVTSQVDVDVDVAAAHSGAGSAVGAALAPETLSAASSPAAQPATAYPAGRAAAVATEGAAAAAVDPRAAAAQAAATAQAGVAQDPHPTLSNVTTTTIPTTATINSTNNAEISSHVDSSAALSSEIGDISDDSFTAPVATATGAEAVYDCSATSPGELITVEELRAAELQTGVAVPAVATAAGVSDSTINPSPDVIHPQLSSAASLVSEQSAIRESSGAQMNPAAVATDDAPVSAAAAVGTKGIFTATAAASGAAAVSPSDLPAATPTAAKAADSDGGDDAPIGALPPPPPPQTSWQVGRSYSPECLAAALAAASVSKSSLAAVGPGDGVSDSDPLVLQGSADGLDSSGDVDTTPTVEQQQQQQQRQPDRDDDTRNNEETQPEEKDSDPEVATATGLSFSDSLESIAGWRRSYSPIKSAGIYFNEQGLSGGAGSAGGSIFAPKAPQTPEKKGVGSIFGSPPPAPPAPGSNRR